VGTHHEFEAYSHPTFIGSFSLKDDAITPEPIRWNPSVLPDIQKGEEIDFVDGIFTLAGTGDSTSLKGMAIHTFSCNKDMTNRSFYNSDGEMLIIPELSPLHIQTEFGFLYVTPGEVFLLPKGLKMTVTLPKGPSRGWIAEVYEGHGGFQLPNLGPLGSNGLADARHFLVPTAAYEDIKVDYQLIAKFGGRLHTAKLSYSPYDVVGWSGRYHPCKYNLNNFMAFGSATWDHPDPSIHTVLNWPFDGVTNASACDFVCFRGRWDAVEHSFRPPYYHRNAATEFNAVIKINQSYSGFDRGVYWLTPLHSAHGISAKTCEEFRSLPADKGEGPIRLSDNSMWVMFESSYPLILTRQARDAANRDVGYRREFFWGVQRLFSGPPKGSAFPLSK
jgi:homogentisate 1,2-dioxygenase